MQGKANTIGTQTSAAKAKKSKPLLNSQPKHPLPLLSLPFAPHGQIPERTPGIPNLERELPPLANPLDISPLNISKNIIPANTLNIQTT